MVWNCLASLSFRGTNIRVTDSKRSPCPCPLTKGVRLREVIDVVFERGNRLDRGLVSANGKWPLTRGVR